jgi:hypothetical protein
LELASRGKIGRESLSEIDAGALGGSAHDDSRNDAPVRMPSPLRKAPLRFDDNTMMLLKIREGKLRTVV